MVTPDNSFYGLQKWKTKRAKILRRDQYQCQISRRYGKFVEAKIVHHIFPRSQFPEYQYSDWNLISVSGEVHRKLHEKNSDRLSKMGKELLIRTARKQGIDITGIEV